MTLGQMLERSAERYPKKLAVIFENRQVTYKELNMDANRLGRVLNKLGVAKGDKVGMLMPNCPEYIVGVFAALKTGAAFVPIKTSLQGRELVHVIEHSDTKTIIAAPPYDELLVILRPKLSQEKQILTIDPNPKEEGLISIPSLMGSSDDTNLRPVVEAEDLAAIYYTLGTTGLPKGVMLTHTNILTNIVSIGQAVKARHNDILLTCLPLSHAFAMTACVMLSVFGGMTDVLLEGFLPQLVLKGISDWNVTFFLGIPAMYATLAEMPHLEKYDVSHLRIGFCCEAPLMQAVIDKFESRFPCKIYEGYGLAECSPGVSVNPFNQRKIGSIGKPLNDRIKWRIVDIDGNEVLRNIVGELTVSGSNVMKGYYKDEEATQQTIQDEWLYTGDMAYMDEGGFVFVADRKKDIILVEGETVYPKEVEDVLTRHPAIQDAGVIGVEDPIRGAVPKAYIVPVPGTSVNEHEVLTFCQEHLAPFKVPHSLEVIDFIPRSAFGKILRRGLRRIAAGLPEEEFDEEFEEETLKALQAPAPSIVGISLAGEFDALLRRLVTEIPGGVAASISGTDGVGLSSFATSPDFPTIIADAKLAAVMSECRGSAEILSFGNPQKACFVTERYGLMMQQIGQYIITLITEAGGTDWEAIQAHFDQLVPLIAKGLF